MKIVRYIACAVVGVACIVGGVVALDIIPKRRFDSLPQWLQVVLFVCLVISCAEVVYGFIEDYRRIWRGRQYKTDEELQD
jgi:hypothetical protein